MGFFPSVATMCVALGCASRSHPRRSRARIDEARAPRAFGVDVVPNATVDEYVDDVAEHDEHRELEPGDEARQNALGCACPPTGGGSTLSAPHASVPAIPAERIFIAGTLQATSGHLFGTRLCAVVSAQLGRLRDSNRSIRGSRSRHTQERAQDHAREPGAEGRGEDHKERAGRGE